MEESGCQICNDKIWLKFPQMITVSVCNSSLPGWRLAVQLEFCYFVDHPSPIQREKSIFLFFLVLCSLPIILFTSCYVASIFFFIGMETVLLGLPIIGMGLEAFGFINLFGDFFPVAIAFLKRTPVIGMFLMLPGVRNIVDRFEGSTSKLPV